MLGEPDHLPGGSSADPGLTTFSGGFAGNPLSRRKPGFLNQTAESDPRRMMRTGYSREDVEEARDGLRLLKNKMDSVTKRKAMSNSQSANRDTDHGFRQHGGLPANQSMNLGGYNNNRRSQHTAGAPKPPMMPPASSQHQSNNMDAMNTSATTAGGGQPGDNYRRAFKPNLPSTNPSS